MSPEEHLKRDPMVEYRDEIAAATLNFVERIAPGKVIAVHVHPELTARILGDRTNHPKYGAHSDLRVVYGDGRPTATGFSYYADAYRHAALDVEPANITRHGRKARRA